MFRRQGDPGSTRFFLSLDDNMFRIFGGDRIRSMMSLFQIEDVPIESGMLVSFRPLPSIPYMHYPHFFNAKSDQLVAQRGCD